tara:strand:+ start:1104 stop:1514 length:411 start_codon:yes stop_codon:yes gene_type:complete
MTHQRFHNDTASLNQLWYDSHKNIIADVCIKLGHDDKIAEMCETLLGPQNKIKKFQDPKKPKRGKSGYLYFCDEMRAAVTEELAKGLKKNEKLPLGKVSKVLGKRWQNLDDDERKPFIESSIKDKARYEAEMADYN